MSTPSVTTQNPCETFLKLHKQEILETDSNKINVLWLNVKCAAIFVIPELHMVERNIIYTCIKKRTLFEKGLIL